MELGLGVHGEAGVSSLALTTASEAVSKMLDHMTDSNSDSRIELKPGEKLAVILNNLGGTSKLEELIVAREVITQLEGRGHSVVRMWAGHMMTSLEMAGILVSILKVSEHPDWIQLLDSPTSAPAWPVVLHSVGGKERRNPDRVKVEQGTEELLIVKGAKLTDEGTIKVKTALERLSAVLVGMEDRLNELDSGSGDGDCGSTLAAGAKAVMDALPELSLAHPLALLNQLSSIAENMGGTSGGIYSILLTAGSRAFQDQVGGAVDVTGWVRALRLGIEAVMQYGGANIGDRTMVDALYPALENLEGNLEELRERPGQALAKAAQEAMAGSRATATMEARAGRASYVAKDKVVGEDPGAAAAAAWFNAIAEVFW